MLDCLERLDATVDLSEANAPSETWPDILPPAFARHPDEDEDVDEEGLDDEDLDEEDFDEEDEDFDEDEDIDENEEDEDEDLDID